MTEKRNFEESMNRLDEIVEVLENNEVNMDEALKLFSEGLELAKICNKQLTDFENKANELLKEYSKND